eukprot:TRINITY_DN5810_c0_g1_i1.p1 TRINITY_DN5810_c0_g1~~TRINITY_DN5810_c0_g1_i1.p1  ORF type:complete len:382 (-),score=135.33 TRINITY_DN5810_c0_g1_i1:44-1189(-)
MTQNTRRNYSSLLITGYSPIVALRSSTGSCDALLALDEIRPQWQGGKSLNGNIFKMFERIDLYNGEEGCKLVLDPSQYSQFYCYSSSSIYKIRLPWLEEMSEGDLDSFSPSEAEHLNGEYTSLSKEKSIKGIQIISEPSLGHYLLAATDSSPKCLLFNLDPLYSLNLPSFEEHYKKRPNRPQLTTKESGSLQFSDPKSLQFINATTHTLQQNYINWATELNLQIISRLDSMKTVKSEQEHKLKDLEDSINESFERHKEFQLKLNKAVQFQTKLKESAESVSSFIRKQKLRLSIAEKEFQNEMKHVEQQKLKRYKEKLEEFEVQFKIVLQSTEEEQKRVNLSEKQMESIYVALREQGNLIQNAVEKVKNLSHLVDEHSETRK